MLDIVTDGDYRFRHDQEGPDDMAAHIRSVITQTTITVPIDAGKCALGTWQGIYLWEHRTNSHHRRIMLTAYG
jgi:secondary thiamine-phosphate synthase enzyme